MSLLQHAYETMKAVQLQTRAFFPLLSIYLFLMHLRSQDIMRQVQLRTKELNAGLPEQGPLEVWEEVKWDPTLIADRLNPT